YRAIRERKRTFPVGRHGDGVTKNAAKLIEIASFMGRGDQLPLPISGRNLDTKDRRAVVVSLTRCERHERKNACRKSTPYAATPFLRMQLHDEIFRLRKSRISGTISSALSSSAKWPVSMR